MALTARRKPDPAAATLPVVITAAHIVDFWFGPDRKGLVSPEISRRWWTKEEAFDHEIAQRFRDLYLQATAGDLDEWCVTAQGRLALVIVLDQFSRNLFRQDRRAWAQDGQALAHTLVALELGEDTELTPIERTMLYMPLMHAESTEAQRLGVERFEALAASCNGELAEAIARNADFARQHQVIIDRFGRFPHRNAVLGRTSTPEEEAFLAEPGSSF